MYHIIFNLNTLSCYKLTTRDNNIHSCKSCLIYAYNNSACLKFHYTYTPASLKQQFKTTIYSVMINITNLANITLIDIVFSNTVYNTTFILVIPETNITKWY